MTGRPISLIINTCNRVASLERTLDALRWLDYRNFEVIVVNGPSDDGTDRLLARWEGRIKVAACGDRNLSASRNIGVQVATGEIVAFIDDDAYPDPAWLTALNAAYDDEEVAAAGGPTFDHTGVTFQAWRSHANRVGEAWWDPGPGPDPSKLLAFPGTESFLYNVGTNCSFRRDRLVAIGGFDEEIRYYAEEVDVCVRLVDRGWVIAALDQGFVYHKALSSSIRRRPDAVNDWSEILKSRFYFGLKHGMAFSDVCQSLANFVETVRAQVTENVNLGRLTWQDATKFEIDARRSSNLALERYASGTTGERDPGWFEAGAAFLPFEALRPPGGKLHLCMVTQDYPPGPMHGIARVDHALATSLAARGHVVRVITRGSEHNRVDLEDGVWVHRIVVERHPNTSGLASPQFIWDSAATMLDEIRRVDDMRPVDLVVAPNWDSEGIAALVERAFPVVVRLFTPLSVLVQVDILDAGRPVERYMAELLDLERYCYEHADGFVASTAKIVEQVHDDYGIVLPPDRTGTIPHGLPDMAAPGGPTTAGVRAGPVRFLFVGRLEARKGIDTLFDAFRLLIARGADVECAIVGDDTLPFAGGLTARRGFEESSPELLDRVLFLGRVSDDELLRQYRRSDVIVAPSRFESFGLMLVEAMMFARPSICTDVGAMPRVVEDGNTAIVVPVDDPGALADAMAVLAGNPELRRSMGAAGRRRYEQCFGADVMAASTETFFRRLIEVRRSATGN